MNSFHQSLLKDHTDSQTIRFLNSDSVLNESGAVRFKKRGSIPIL